MRLVISSDNHIDVNRLDLTTTLQFQANWLVQHQVDLYFHLGDLFNNFGQTKAYFQQLQLLVPQTKCFYLAGNHEMINLAPFSMLEGTTDSRYFHKSYLDLPGTNWRIIGNNGWYDYSFSTFAQESDRVAKWKNVYWLDSTADQPLTDQARMDQVLQTLTDQFKNAQQNHRQVILLTHFAPQKVLLHQYPATLSVRRQEAAEMIRAMMGSQRLGKLIQQYPNVKQVYYGHLHGYRPQQTIGNVDYINVAVGVNKRRHNEWDQPNFKQQWVQHLKVLNF